MTRQHVYARAAGSSLVVDLGESTAGASRAHVLHWGADLGALSAGDVAGLRAALTPGVMNSDFDAPHVAGVAREAAAGFLGHPAVSGYRRHEGVTRAWSPMFAVTAVEASGENDVTLVLVDQAAALTMRLRYSMDAHGVVRVSASLTNDGADEYVVQEIITWLPLPSHAAEIMDFTGRWSKERRMQRQLIHTGTWLRESLEGRSGHDHTVLQMAMTAGADFAHGEVWAVALAWSGNLQYRVERLYDGRTAIGAGEVLLPGEMVLGPGATYAAPDVLAVYSGVGIDGVSERFYAHVRARAQHPARPRPVTLNVWEAVYFDHDLARLTALAERAARIGVERFVLDDGWFHLRRDDRAGLGDWWVDPAVWPQGLGPLIDRVRALGMEFGLWFEPEMVNPDSDLFRAHPDWLVHVDGRTPPTWRNQHVLNIAHPEAYAYLLGKMDALLTEYEIAYIKWDHNRVLVDSGDGVRPIVHEQTLAFYRLVDELKRRHPGLEIESCASGGARIDFGALEHTDRFWTSDCTDAIERQQIQRWSQIAVPPELLGSHISAPFGHQTSRHAHLHFRAITALFGHPGIEWDITQASDSELELLASWTAFYRHWRDVLHTGRMVRIDHSDPAVWVHGVVAQDHSRALFALVQMETSRASRPAAVRLRGLDPAARYRVEVAYPVGEPYVMQIASPGWLGGLPSKDGRPVTDPAVVSWSPGASAPNPAGAAGVEGASVPHSGGAVGVEGASAPHSAGEVGDQGASAPHSGGAVGVQGAPAPHSGGAVGVEGASASLAPGTALELTGLVLESVGFLPDNLMPGNAVLVTLHRLSPCPNFSRQ